MFSLKSHACSIDHRPIGYSYRYISRPFEKNLFCPHQWCSWGNAAERGSSTFFTLSQILARLHFLLEFLLQFPAFPHFAFPHFIFLGLHHWLRVQPANE